MHALDHFGIKKNKRVYDHSQTQTDTSEIFRLTSASSKHKHETLIERLIEELSTLIQKGLPGTVQKQVCADLLECLTNLFTVQMSTEQFMASTSKFALTTLEKI